MVTGAPLIMVVKLPPSLVKHHHEDVWGSGGIAPFTLNFGTRWKWVVSFTSQGKNPWQWW